MEIGKHFEFLSYFPLYVLQLYSFLVSRQNLSRYITWICFHSSLTKHKYSSCLSKCLVSNGSWYICILFLLQPERLLPTKLKKNILLHFFISTHKWVVVLSFFEMTKCYSTKHVCIDQAAIEYMHDTPMNLACG